MKNTIKSKLALFAIAGLVTLHACKKDPEGGDPTNPPVVNPEEQITTVVLTGYNHDDPDNVAYHFSVKWEDLDGSGGNAPVIDSLVLDTGIEYHVHVLLLDKTKTPYDTISNEVEEEADVHQFFYTPSASLTDKVSIERLDFDNNNPPLPVGLEFHMNTQSSVGYTLPVVGGLNIVLSHYDGVPKTTAPSSESDIDIAFPVRLK